MDKKNLDRLLEYVYKIPQLLGLAVISFFSGHLWLWVIFAFYKTTTKGDKYLTNNYAKTALGVFWFAIFLFPAYLIKFGANSTVDTNVFQLIGFTLILGSFVQGIGTIIIILVNNKK
jgi:hypothetical protein